MTKAERDICIRALQQFARSRAPENWTTGMLMMPPAEREAMWDEGEKAEWLAVKLGGPMTVHPGRNAAKVFLNGKTAARVVEILEEER